MLDLVMVVTTGGTNVYIGVRILMSITTHVEIHKKSNDTLSVTYKVTPYMV